MGERDRPERARIGTASAAGLAEWEGKTIYVSRVCVILWAVLWREVGKAGRIRYVRSVSGGITSETFVTGYWILPCA